MVGRIPLLSGWKHYSDISSQVQQDSAAEDGRLGSNIYEVNQWLWQFGLGKPLLGGLTIKDTLDRTMLPAKGQTSIGRRLVRVARVMVPDWK